MDSFYDQPRSAPIPTNIDQFLSSRVPEVSIIVPPDVNSPKSHQLLPTENKIPYNVWKTQNQNKLEIPRQRFDKENLVLNNENEYNSQNSSKISRKHVRFNSSQVQKPVLEPHKDIALNSSNTMVRANEQESRHKNEYSETVRDKPFEQIYMANIPNRHLDLSIMESSNYMDKENNKQKNGDNSATNIFLNKTDEHIEYKSNSEYYDSSRNVCKPNFPHIQKTTYPFRYKYQLEPTRNRQDDYRDPTVKDLLKVVQQQNEQILLLQKQVSLLLQNQSNQKQVQVPAFKNTSHLQNTINCTETENAQYHNPNGSLPKLAIDVMTSFEVSIRPPNAPQNKLLNECSTKPKIQEITNTELSNHGVQKLDSIHVNTDTSQNLADNNETKQISDLSLILDKPIEIVERCPSPANSVHVDMKDYSSDSEDGSSEFSADIGWTVYNNIMEQVNNLLKKSNNGLENIECSSNSVTDKTLKKVKEATMRHLKCIGVNLPRIEELDTSQRSNETVNGSEYTPTEVSFAVKQLLMKYLPDEQLSKMTHTPSLHPMKGNMNYNTENLIKRRPEFSFATVQYMEKYNLLTSDTVLQEPQQPNKHADVPKILDVTALKQQPKLL